MAGLDASPPRHFPSFGAHSCLGGGFRVPEEPSNRYHARHLIDKDHPDAALGQGSSFTRSYSPEQLIADSQCSQAAAENLYTSVAVGHCVWNHVYPGESAPPLPVTGICLSGEGSQYQDSYQQQQQQCGVLGAWSTTTFRPSLAHGHSLWDHDGTDFSSGYTTQKLSSQQATQDTRRSRSTGSSRGRHSEAQPRPKSVPPSRPAVDTPCTEPTEAARSGRAMQATNKQVRTGAVGMDAELTEAQQHWEYDDHQTSTAAAGEVQRLTGAEAGEPMSHSQASGAGPKVTRRGDSPYPNSWFSHTPVAVLAQEREVAKQKEAMLLSQFHPRPGAKHPSRSKAVHRTVWGSGAGGELLYGDPHVQDEVGGEAVYGDAPGAAVEGDGGWLEAQMSLQEHDTFSSRCSSSAGSGELSWQHPKEHHPHGADVEEAALSAISESVSEEEERSSSSGGGGDEHGRLPQRPAAAGQRGAAGATRGQSPFQGCPPFQETPAWPADARAASQAPTGAAAAAAALGDRTPSAWWRSNAKLAALVQQMLQSPAKARVHPLMPDVEQEDTLGHQLSGALQAPLLAPRGSCQSSPATAAVSDTAAAGAAMALCGRASPSLTWAKYCSNLQTSLTTSGTGGDTRVMSGDTAVTPGVHRAAPVEQQHAAWVSELLDRPVKERLRLLELHSWAATHGSKAKASGDKSDKAGKISAARAAGSPGR